jgi:hypothetical protein
MTFEGNMKNVATKFAAIATLCMTVAATVALPGCGGDYSNQGVDQALLLASFRAGVIRTETVKSEVPQGRTEAPRSQALTVERHEFAALGQISDLYKLTLAVSSVINGTGIFIGLMVKAVLEYPPTMITSDTAVWGPFDSDNALEPISWRVTVKRLMPGKHEWRFDGKNQLDDTASFLTFISGIHNAALNRNSFPVEGFGTGEMTMDWDARQKIFPNTDETGSARFFYSRLGGGQPTTITAAFRQVLDKGKKDSEGVVEKFDLDYAYQVASDRSGSMEFTRIVAPKGAMPGGKWAVHSRWQSNGAGRSDVKATSTDSATMFIINDCWDHNFLSTFARLGWDAKGGYGEESSCVFPVAEYSDL